MRSRLPLVLILWLLSCGTCAAAEVQVAVADAQGHPLKDALVIVQDLNHGEHELFRALTADTGQIAPRSLQPGFYRAISTYPYAHWKTSVREFLVRDQPVKVRLQMESGESLDDLPVSIGRLTVHVLDAHGQPAAGARVLVRDAEAHAYSEHWGSTDAQGTTTLEMSDTPSTLLVVYRDQLSTFPTSGWETERTLRLK